MLVSVQGADLNFVKTLYPEKYLKYQDSELHADDNL